MTKGLLVLAAVFFMRSASAQTSVPSATGHPNFEGIWNSATATPLERPAQFKDHAFFTPKEAAEWERKISAGNQAAYNKTYFEVSSRVLKTLRTSIVTDPPNGRIPALTPAAAEARRLRIERLHHPRNISDMGLQDRCLVFPTSVAPMLPYRYNSNYQIVQTPDALVVHAEMIHDTRIIHLDGRPHINSTVRLWLGDSIGHWEGGNTLVVDTTNFNDAGGFYGDAGGMYGWDRNMHVVERFSLMDADTILYRFEVDDPTAFTRPWKGELLFARSPGPIYEYACHEGNYDLPNIIRVSRAQ